MATRKKLTEIDSETLRLTAAWTLPRIRHDIVTLQGWVANRETEIGVPISGTVEAFMQKIRLAKGLVTLADGGLTALTVGDPPLPLAVSIALGQALTAADQTEACLACRDFGGAILMVLDAQGAIARAAGAALELQISQARDAGSQKGRTAADVRVANDPRRKLRPTARRHWDSWDGKAPANRTELARNVLADQVDVREHDKVRTVRTITDWFKEFEDEDGIS